MIGFFPKPYEDELAYSVFARYFERSGYLCYSSAAEDIYINPHNKPNIEFCNLLTDDALTQIGDIECFIQNHTMLNFYTSFLPLERRDRANKLACDMKIKELMNALPIPKNAVARYLKYCPICAKKDRDMLGETYWHRSCQIYGISACYKHSCKLIDSDIPITSSASPSFNNAEKSIVLPNEVTQALPAETELAIYLFEILKSNHTPKSDVATFLKSFLHNTPYVSPRGAKRYIKTLSDDFKSHYSNVNLFGFGEPWQLEKILCGNTSNPYQISLVGMFLGIEAKDLLKRESSHKSQNTKDFDNNIQRLKLEGLSYRQIANQVGLSYDYCKAISYGKRVIKRNKSTSHQGGKKVNWEELDAKTLPTIIALIDNLHNSIDRPKRISIGLIERLSGLQECQLKKLPLCLEYVNAQVISQEEFWAKIIEWAIKKLIEENLPIHLTNIMRLTNLRKKNIKTAIPFIKQYLDVIEHNKLLSSL